VLVARSMDPRWLSNAYLVADEDRGTAVFVDSGAPTEPLLEAAREWRVTPSHILRTHGHALGLPVVRGPLEVGGLTVEGSCAAR
jgi:glyoxylase-like metal-dependent hydrolase (beta-lactamase superfamily II)